MHSFTRIIFFICVLASASSFITNGNDRRPHLSSQLNIFGKAFANDESLGKAENPGLKKGPNMSEVTINGKPVKAVAGQKVSQVLAAARVKVTYSCRKGDCGTCELFMNGRVEKACNAKIPQGKCVIQTS
jgi:ferredoxin